MQQLLFVALLCFVAKVSAECPGACSGHGTCGTYDQCSCFRNWQAADCSERICQFNTAFVDTPKGDLNSNQAVSGPGTSGSFGGANDLRVVYESDMYGQEGTTEQYPAFKQGLGTVIAESGHELAECSAKGMCDRASGTCECFEGYSGSACQYTTCPETDGLTCSGHGVCKSALEISKGFYQLWDRDAQQGCVCDSGYEGFDCSERKCKPGTDPLSYEGARFGQYNNFTFIIYQKVTTGRDSTQRVQGTYKLRIPDDFNKMWETRDIPISSTCDTITDAVRAIPHPSFSDMWIRCHRNRDTIGYQVSVTGTSSSFDPADGQSTTGFDDGSNRIVDSNRFDYEKYILSFGRQSELSTPEIIMHDNEQRPTLYPSIGGNTVYGKVYVDGHASHDIDIFPNSCDNVYIRLFDSGTGYVYLKFGISGDTDVDQAKLFASCLGDSDGDWTNNFDGTNGENEDILNFDYGTMINPHVIQLFELSQYNCKSYDPYPNALWDISSCDSEDDITIPENYVCPHPHDLLAAENTPGFCHNKNPAGLVTPIFYAGDTWRIYSHIDWGYSTSTVFKAFTMDGQFQNVNINGAVVGAFDVADDSISMIAQQYTNMFHSINISVDTSDGSFDHTFNGDFSCEDLTGSSGYESTTVGTAAGSKQCLVNGDKVIFYSLPRYEASQTNLFDSDMTNSLYQAIQNCNGPLTNLLTVQNAAKYPNSYTAVDGRPPVNQQDFAQFFVETTVATNRYMEVDQNTEFGTQDKLPGCAMFIFKYIKNTTVNNAGEYHTTAPCSNRGICDSSTGTCDCFHGYGHDNCDTVMSVQ